MNLLQKAVPTLRFLLRWIPLASLAGILAGTASALLIVSLNIATDLRNAHLWLIALLPVAGLLVGIMYLRYGTRVEAGNNLILDEIHVEITEEVENTRRTIPLRMTPLILISTFVTHVFGGSAGREGTALQTGASLADQLARPFGLHQSERRILLMAGGAAGFGSVFGVPLAGAIFGLEVLAVGSINYDALIPCLISSFVGDLTTRAWHIHHDIYHVVASPQINLSGFIFSALAGAIFGFTAFAFARLAHWVSHTFMLIKWPPLRPFVGGILIALAVAAIHSTRYIGLGTPVIDAAFTGPLPPWDWAGKLLFTALTLGAAFKGGEVTPLFFIGATLGNALSTIIPLPLSLLAGMGFVAVFAGAANTPIASILMAVELFGADAGAYAAIACIFSYLCSGHRGIYASQRISAYKPYAKLE